MPVVTTSPAAAPATPTDKLFTCVRNKLDDWTIEAYLTTAFTTGSATFTVNDGTLFGAGEEWEFGDATREVILVRSISTNDITPKFGHRGSPTNVDHPLGAILRRKPRFTDDEIFDALTASCDGLWPTVYGIGTDTIVPVTTGQTNFPAPSDAERLISASQADASSDTTKKYTYTTFSAEGRRGSQPDIAGANRIYLVHGRPIGQYSTLKTWLLPDGFYHQTYNVNVNYAFKVSPGTAETGLMSDVVCWGAVAELLGAGSARRSRGPTDGPSVLDNLRAASNAERKYDLGKSRLVADLNRRYPVARQWRG